MRSLIRHIRPGEGGAIAAFVTPALLVIVIVPITFIVLQAIFPRLGAGSLEAPFSMLGRTFEDPRIWRWTLNTLMLGMAVVFAAQKIPIDLSLHRDIRAAIYGADYDGG